MQGRLYGLFCYNHQYDAAIGKGKFILNQIPKDKLAKYKDDPFFAIIFDGVDAFMRYQEIQRRDLLGLPCAPEDREKTMKLYQNFYDKWFKYGQF